MLLESKRSALRSELTTSLTTDRLPVCRVPGCTRVPVFRNQLAQSLKNLGVYPLDFDNHSLAHYVARLDDISLSIDARTPACLAQALRPPQASCLRSKDSPVDWYAQKILIERKARGLCLDCLREGDAETKKCRIEHN